LEDAVTLITPLIFSYFSLTAEPSSVGFLGLERDY